MSDHGSPFPHERIFSVAEANALIPELEQLWGSIKRGKQILIETKDEVEKASAKADLGGGTVSGVKYIKGLQDINGSLHAIQDLGILVKDVEIGLCDFPYMLNDQMVFLCWKCGEKEIQWWHEIDSGYSNRKRLSDEAK